MQTAAPKTSSKVQASNQRRAAKSPISHEKPIIPFGTSSTPRLQRKAACACGGNCPRCKSSPVQAKVIVGPANDIYEQEADRVANHVMREPDTTKRRKPG